MAESLNLGQFSRIAFTNPDGTLTREAQKAMAVVQRRNGDLAGLVYADSITNVPSGGIAASDVQAAIDELDFEKQTKDATLTALAAVATAADRLIYATGSDAFAVTVFTAFARTLLDDADATAMRSTLGLVIGTNVQAFDAELAAIAGLTSASDRLPYFTGSGTAALATFTSAGRDLVDDADATAQRTTLGLGTIATQNANNVSITGGTIALASGSLGYATGNGGTATQNTDKSTTVILNEPSGEITMDAANLNAGTIVSFTLTNSTIAGTDVLILNHVSGGTVGAYTLNAAAGAGSAVIYVRNATAGNLAEAVVIRFAVIKAATS